MPVRYLSEKYIGIIGYKKFLEQAPEIKDPGHFSIHYTLCTLMMKLIRIVFLHTLRIFPLFAFNLIHNFSTVYKSSFQQIQA